MAVRMREVRPEVPIIIATGARGSYTEETALRAGFSYLEKPYTLEQLGSTVADCIERYYSGQSDHRPGTEEKNGAAVPESA